MKCLHNSISTPQTVDQKNLHTVSSQLIQGKYKNRLWNEFQSSKKGLPACFPAFEYFALPLKEGNTPW